MAISPEISNIFWVRHGSGGFFREAREGDFPHGGSVVSRHATAKADRLYLITGFAYRTGHLRRHLERCDSYRFFNILTDPDLMDHVELLLPENWQRLFPPTEVVSMFLAQALNADRPCRRAVNSSF